MNVIEDGIPLGEMSDLQYFIDKRNRLINRGHGAEATKKVDNQLRVMLDLMVAYVNERIDRNEII